MVIRFFKKIVVLIEQRKKEIKFKKRKNLLTSTMCQSNWMALHMHLTRKKEPYVIQNKCYWALSNLWTTGACTIIRAFEIGHKNEVKKRKKRLRVPPLSIFPIPQLKATSFPGLVRRDVKVPVRSRQLKVASVRDITVYKHSFCYLANQVCNEWIKQNNPGISGRREGKLFSPTNSRG